jgi:N-acyl-D-amino-acid deacylase
MQAGSHDVVIRQAAVFDGHGNPPFIADVAIDDDRIAHIGEIPGRGGIEIDGRGLAVAPGFIDVIATTTWPCLSRRRWISKLCKASLPMSSATAV